MKKVILLALFLPYMANGQIIENFESASLSNWVQSIDGRWKADTANSISGIFSLHHVFDNSTSGNDCIGIPINNLHPDESQVHWEFLIRHGYDPSASNSWCVYLMSDIGPAAQAAGTAVNGFVVGVNLTGYDDTLRIWKTNSGNPSVVVTCPVNWQNDIGILNEAKIEVERSISGTWGISVYDEQGKILGSGSGIDNQLFLSSFFILSYRYTSTRDRILWFDDLTINGVFREDTQPPEVVNCRVSGINSVDLTLNEEPSDNFMLVSNFSLFNSNNTPVNIIRESEKIFRLIFNNDFSNKTLNNLIINRLCDRSGNCNERINVEFTLINADAGDVIITEIMADPLPVVSLPAKEYLEIMNRSHSGFNLKRWSLSTESQTTRFPETMITQGDYIILCSQADTILFSGYGKVIGLKSFPALTDDGRILCLSDSLGNLIHGVEYSSSWYGNKLKETGGWSLEMIDTGYPFYTEGNWEASYSRSGGSPGKINSSVRNNPDQIFYGIENVFPDDSVTIRVDFSETLFNLAGLPDKISFGNRKAVGISSEDPLLKSFIVRSPVPFKTHEVYEMNINSDVTDFSGNLPARSSFRFGLFEKAIKGDIVFNELLFNPFPDDPDYIELFNDSENVIDASQLYLASINPDTGDTSDISALLSDHRCILPGTYFTITTDRIKVIERYTSSGPENIFNASSLPSMADDRGHLLLLNRNLELVDEVIYTDKMQYPLLAGNEGVSLEKLRPGLRSDECASWYSASESSGWGTPGRENSVFTLETGGNDIITFSSARISPDNDGMEDALVIDINAGGFGNIVSVTIFDETGGYVRKLKENFFAQNNVSVVWDGTTDDGSLVSTGVYIVLIEMYNDKGKTKSWKKVCTVIR